MNKEDKIKLIKNTHIDLQKWDACVNRAPFGKLYARSWYLDVVAKDWQALVWGDYEFVMPLPVKSKGGIRYIGQPPYLQQAGIYPTPDLNIQKKFAEKLNDNFRLVSYQLNAHNDEKAFTCFKAKEKVNYVLPLISSYSHIISGYAKHTRRNLKSAEKSGISVVKGLQLHDYLEAKKLSAGPTFSKQDFFILNRIMAQSITSGQGTVYAAYTKENNLCAAAFFILDAGRIYYLNSFSDNEGRKNMAMYAIIDKVIQEYAGTGRSLDFEGSVIKNIAWFFRGFGPLAEKYFYIYSNRLPVIRWFMKK